MQSKSSLIYKCKLYCFNYIVLFNGMRILMKNIWIFTAYLFIILKKNINSKLIIYTYDQKSVRFFRKTYCLITFNQ